MDKRILILGTGLNVAKALRKARELGLESILLDHEPDDECRREAAIVVKTSWREPENIVAAAKAHGATSVLPAPEPGHTALAHASAQLGLLLPDAKTVHRMTDKVHLRKALHGVLATPRFRLARSPAGAEEAAEALGMPIVVKPRAAHGSRGVFMVHHPPEVPLAFKQAARHSSSGDVLIEECLTGQEYIVEGVVFEGTPQMLGIIQVHRPEGAVCVPVEAVCPAPLSARATEQLHEAAAKAVQTLGMRHGPFHIEMIRTPAGPHIIEAAPYPSCLRWPEDLILEALGYDCLEVTLRTAAGLEFEFAPPAHTGAAALCWIPSHSGVILEVVGAAEAASMAGVRRVSISAKPGDVLGHVVDGASRDRLGYVLAAGDTPEEALLNACNARERCAIVTSPFASSDE